MKIAMLKTCMKNVKVKNVKVKENDSKFECFFYINLKVVNNTDNITVCMSKSNQLQMIQSLSFFYKSQSR